MARSARERLAGLLGGSTPARPPSAQMTAPADALQLEVSGMGPVGLPVRAPVARKLVAAARPAKFGRGEQTLVDTTVRDTWEIAPDQITLGGRRWPALMERALEHFRDELGLGSTARLRAEPHSMLVYGKGQFFLPHQDSEKDDEMVATLVVSLPSIHTGGELVVTHAGENRTYHASRDELTLVAFYADCRHEVKPVRSGYRATITFNLLHTAETPEPPAEPDAELVARLTEHFTTPVTRSYTDTVLDPPNRLVFLLDHEYTQRNLGWERLKGDDAARTARLRAAAQRAGCEAVLALAEVKEIWDAASDGYDDWDYHDVGDDPDDVELGDLIDNETTLGWWTTPDGAGGEQISLHVRDHEVCAATPSVELTPYEAQYEGYMGNYGNTMDRWYRRAAVVVWPQDRAFAARAEAGSSWALQELRGRIDSGDLDGARVAAASLAPFWRHVGAEPGLLGVTLEVAAGLDAAETAAMLLAPFRLEKLTPDHAAGLAAVAARYGQEWTRTVVAGWSDPRHSMPDRDDWIRDNLLGLCTALRAAGDPQLVRFLTVRTWGAMQEWMRYCTRIERADSRQPALEKLSAPLLRLLEASDNEQRDEVVGELAAFDDTVLECLIPALRQADPFQAPWLHELVRDCVKRLDTITARPPRADGDWSIAWTGCGCEVCTTLEAFLGSRSEQVHRWPIRQDGRQHIHSRLDIGGLPVRHETERRGRPYTLVLTKTPALFTREASARDKARDDLAWLRSTWGL